MTYFEKQSALLKQKTTKLQQIFSVLHAVKSVMNFGSDIKCCQQAPMLILHFSMLWSNGLAIQLNSTQAGSAYLC